MFSRWMLVSLVALFPQPSLPEQIGEKAADFRLPDTAGREHSLQQYISSGKVILLEFWSFKCPVSLAQDKRLAALQERFQDRGVVILAVDSNVDEPADAVRRNAEMLQLSYPVLVDREGELASRLGVDYSPGVCIIDRNGVLRYRGALDNNKHLSERGRVPYAEEALEAVLAGRTVSRAETKILGCSIKRKSF